tara:strand:- start:3032 stop:4267 length:1236 start_codon:yes stop_codon:yes gene_type:complete
MWLKKYAPKTLDEFVGNHKAIYDLKKLYSNDNCNTFIITGQTGIGKTLLTKLFFKEYNYEVNELSLCEEKNNSSFKNKFEKMLNFKNIIELMSNKKFGIILKDVDNCINDILKIIKRSSIQRTVFIILNNSKNLKKIKNCNKIQLKKPLFVDIEKFVFNILIDNKYIIDTDGLKLLYEYSNGDIRFIILFLEDIQFNIARKRDKLNLSDDKFITFTEDEMINLIEIKKKDISYDIYNAIENILFVRNSITKNLQYGYTDTYFIPTIIYDNLQDILLNNNNDISDYLNCLEHITISEFLNIKMFEYQNSVTNDINLILNIHNSNYILTKRKRQHITIKYSVLMNKILRINNSIKFYNKIPLTININKIHIRCLLDYAKYYDNKKNSKKLDEYLIFLHSKGIEKNLALKYLVS